MMLTTKRCRTCGRDLPLTSYPRDNTTYRPDCRDCYNARRKTRKLAVRTPAQPPDYDTAIYKECSVCHEVKRHAEFCKRGDRYAGYCLECHRAKNRRWWHGKQAARKAAQEPTPVKQAIVIPDTRRCQACGHDLPLSAFSRNGSSYRTECKACRAAGERQRSAAAAPRQRGKRGVLVIDAKRRTITFYRRDGKRSSYPYSQLRADMSGVGLLRFAELTKAGIALEWR